MRSQYYCLAPGRIDALGDAAQANPPRLINGIRYLEVVPGQRRLEVTFVHSLALVPAVPLTKANVEIIGGTRVRDPAVTGVTWADNVLSVEVATAGDFSTYTLRLVASAGVAAPPAGIDPALAQIAFSFKVDCPSDYDCKPQEACPPETGVGPVVDYLARDYQSFRRLILDRLAALMPDWRERNPADLWVALAEAIAFRGDELSYYQDGRCHGGVSRHRPAAHLGTAPYAPVGLRVSRRLQRSRLGRVRGRRDRRRHDLARLRPANRPRWHDVADAPAGHADHDRQRKRENRAQRGRRTVQLVEPLTLYTAHNDIRFHTWSDDECCSPRGATQAFLRDDETKRLRLRAGDVIVLQALVSTTTGLAVDADHRQRMAVRLTNVDPEAPLIEGVRGVPSIRRDPVTEEPFVEIAWGDGDALAFLRSASPSALAVRSSPTWRAPRRTSHWPTTGYRAAGR